MISPGEAHERLAQLERRHQVLRRGVELYLEDNPPTGPESLVEALCFVVPQLNQSLSVGGFSPTQWVLGYQPNIPGSLLDSDVNYSHLDPTFQHKMQCRARAATAVVTADNDLRLRRALRRQHRGNPPQMLVGQKCFYGREAAGTGPRIRWKACCTLRLLPPWPSLPNSTDMRAISRTHRVPLPGRADPRLRDLYTFARITLASTPLPHEEGSDSEQLDDDPCVNPDSAEATTTAPTTADRPGTATDKETSTTNTPNDKLHHTFSPEQKRARIDRSDTISHVVHPTAPLLLRRPSSRGGPASTGARPSAMDPGNPLHRHDHSPTARRRNMVFSSMFWSRRPPTTSPTPGFPPGGTQTSMDTWPWNLFMVPGS